MEDDGGRTARAEQRRRTEKKILDAARSSFSEYGYDRSTIRSIAAKAGVNPGLVIHYFTSKKELFASAARISSEAPSDKEVDQIVEGILGELHAKLSQEPTSELAVLRSMLTHPEAAEIVREMVNDQQRQVSDQISAEDTVLRSGLISATILGVMIGRYMLRLDGLRDATPEQITTLLRPCFQSLTRSECVSDSETA